MYEPPALSFNFWTYLYSFLGGRHSSVVSSAPIIMRTRVQIPSTLSMLFSIVLLELLWEKEKYKLKEADIGPFF